MREWIYWICIIGFIVFVGFAIQINIYDKLMETNYAHWFNIIGFCLVPIFGVASIWYMKKEGILELR